MDQPQAAEGQQAMIEMDHSIGYNGKYPDTVKFHPTMENTLLYNIGGLLVIENLMDKHN